MIKTIENMLFQTVYNGSVTMKEWELTFFNSTDGMHNRYWVHWNTSKGYTKEQ